MKPAAVQVRIGRLVVSAAQRTVTAGLSDTIAEALRHELSRRPETAAPIDSRMSVPQTIAQRIATEVAGAGTSNATRGPHGAG
jgi:hypothetical protein